MKRINFQASENERNEMDNTLEKFDLNRSEYLRQVVNLSKNKEFVQQVVKKYINKKMEG